jgi:CheY-like chemotaxis protein
VPGARRGGADIIVTDLVMLGEDGVWLLEQVSGHPRPIPVIVVSGFAEASSTRRTCAVIK